MNASASIEQRVNALITATPPLDSLAIPERHTTLQQLLANANALFDEQFREGADIRQLVQQRALFIDQLLILLWNHFGFNQEENDGINLIAIGGYGRGELQPQSDIDLLLLLREDNATHYQDRIEQFLTLLWDLKLNIGQSVRTVEQCVEAAESDITVVTSLMECRTVCGNGELIDAMRDAISPDNIWSTADFFAAKLEEQEARHARHGINEYDLEPNIKESPGGLRDIQTVIWVAKRYYRVNSLDELRKKALFNDKELDLLKESETLLWRMRYGTHVLAGRPQEKLLFDTQRQLAEQFGYQDTHERLAVEQLMKHYYRTVMQRRLLNEVLMRHLQEMILGRAQKQPITPINEHFQLRGSLLEVTHKKVFNEYPSALLEIFLELASNEQAEGIRASTIRQIRDHCHLIDDEFRASSHNQQLFMQLLQLKYNLSGTLQRMTRYGVLGQYLPEFGNIVGQMQHDLFHIYPVDVHTLQAIKNMRRLGRKVGEEKFPLAASVYKKQKRKDLLMIAALYHDIAKGRGGSHSILGADDVRAFALKHSITEHEANLLAWLVENHLLMSQTSQKQDLSDPYVINRFAHKVQDQIHLDMLFVLTVADVNATNPTLWNSWKASLMSQLYLETSKALARGLENPADRSQWVEETRHKAIQLLEDKGFSVPQIMNIWGDVGDDYFLSEVAEDIVWHTEAFFQHNSDQPMVLIKSNESNPDEGASQIFIRTRDRDNLFAAIAAALDKVQLSIHDAKLYTTGSHYTLDTFYVLDDNNQPIDNNPVLFNRIRTAIIDELALLDEYSEIVKRRTPRQLKQFPVPTRTTLSQNGDRQLTILEVTTADRIGLLAQIGRIFVEFNMRVQNAKIATLGERVEDIFYITDRNGDPITCPELCDQLQQAICEQIDSHVSPNTH